jgi:hypothetical protein
LLGAGADVSALRGVIAGACCAAVVVACAAPSQPMAVAPTSAGAMPATPHDQITDLDKDIAADREKLGLPEPVLAELRSDATATPMTSSTDPACRPGKSDVCTDTCALADSICKNAATICDLAKQMSGDQWAADKCTSGEATCTAAHKRCCGCQ